MIAVPSTRYADRAGVHIAYQVTGAGPMDLVFVWGPYSHIEVAWEHPAFVYFITRLASFSRVIHFDKRGTGLSDRTERVATFEEQIDDVLAVLDAVGSERAALLGGGDAGLLAVLFAAAHPERTTALVLADAHARLLRDDDYPWGPTAPEWEKLVAARAADWGSGKAAFVAPSQSDAASRRWWAKMERYSLSPGAVIPTWQMIAQTDVRKILPAVHVPALVVHRRDDVLVEAEKGRYLAQRLPQARFVELPGRDHPGWAGDADAELDEIQTFLTGVRPAQHPDRMLATVLFTDIVASTERAAALGDHRWRQVLDAHDDIVSSRLAQYRGRLVKATGDGVFAIFDGPVRAIQCATEICDQLQTLGLETRGGLHAGEVEQRNEDIGGIAVHIAERIERLAAPDEVLVSRTVKDLVAGSGIAFDDRGVHSLKGVPDDWQVFAVRRQSQ